MVAAALQGRVEVWVTDEVWAEYEEVLARPKFAKVRAGAQDMLGALRQLVQRTAATSPATAALDEDDNRFLECAAAAEASYLVTGNLRHYPLAFGSTRLVNARGFADATGLLH